MSTNLLKSEAERRALKALELSQYQELNLNAIKTKLTEILGTCAIWGFLRNIPNMIFLI